MPNESGYNKIEMSGNKNNTSSNQRGIALGEVLLLVFLISILAIIIVPRFLSVSQDAKYEACRTHVANIDSLVQLYYVREGTWPLSNLSDIGSNINYFPEATLPQCPVTDSAAYTIATPSYRVTGHLRTSPTHP